MGRGQFFSFFFLWLHPRHLEVSGPQVESKPHLQSTPQLWQRQILNPLHCSGNSQREWLFFSLSVSKYLLKTCCVPSLEYSSDPNWHSPCPVEPMCALVLVLKSSSPGYRDAAPDPHGIQVQTWPQGSYCSEHLWSSQNLERSTPRCHKCSRPHMSKGKIISLCQPPKPQSSHTAQAVLGPCWHMRRVQAVTVMQGEDPSSRVPSIASPVPIEARQERPCFANLFKIRKEQLIFFTIPTYRQCLPL